MALLDAAVGRREIKRLARWVEDQAPELVPHIVSEARRRGVDLPPEAAEWPAKRLVRLARGKEAAARERANPVRLDEPFRCEVCGLDVSRGGRRVRDHCPRCLRSRHVDVVPGDRASRCGGIQEPVGVEVGGREEMVIRYRCRRCGREHRNRALLDGPFPDDPAGLRLLAAGGGAPPVPPADPAGRAASEEPR